MSTIEERVKKIVCEQLGVKEDEVTNSASFVEDLGADSLDTVELVMALKRNSKPKFLMKRRRRSPLFRKQLTTLFLTLDSALIRAAFLLPRSVFGCP